MDKFKSKAILLSLLFLFFGSLSFYLYYSGKSMEGVLYAKNVPIQIGDWDGVDIPMDEQTIRLLETRDILFRVYSKPRTPPVYLCVVYAQNNRRSIHPPEVCYIASGWEVGEKKFFSSSLFDVLPIFRATQIMITKNYYKQLVYYWYKSGDAFTSSMIKHQLNMALSQIKQERIRGALIRLSTEIIDETQEEAAERLNQFTALVIPQLQENLL